MRRRNPSPRAGSSKADADELTGFLEGVRSRLLARQRAGASVPLFDERLLTVQSAIGAGRLAEAERILLDIAERLDRDEPEPELNEFPRGLVRYEAIGDRGIPTPEDEEPIGNRLTLIERLLTVADAEGVAVGELRASLAVARSEYAQGERKRAKETGERVLEELDLRRRTRRRRQS
jgi:hypothetical protein